MTGIVRYPSPTSAVSDLDDLTDVVITSPEEFQGLSYNGTSWVNGHIPVVSYVRNAETTTLTTGTAVYLFGSTGDHATVKRADNGSDTTSSKTVGLVAANITASNNGPVVTRGYVDGIDLSSGYTAGDILWLGENGAFTTTKPSAPDHLVFIGVVVRATSNGIVYVATQNGYELDELHNVAASSPSAGDFLKYNGSLWVNDPINLGTDTTGDYVASLVAGTGISLANNSGEGATPTISSVAARVSDTPPSNPVAGQLWFESDTGKTFVYYDSYWVETTSTGATGPSGVYVGSTAPSNTSLIWADTSATGTAVIPQGGTSGQVLVKNSSTDYDTSWSAPPGLVFIKSQTIGTAVTSVTVTDAFSSTYDNYLITISGGVCSTNVEISLRMGTVSSNYSWGIVYTTYATATASALRATSASSVQYVGRGTTSTLTMSCEVRGPNLAKPTYVTTNYVAEDAVGVCNGIHTDSTQHTSFTIFPQLGTITGGTIRVYGYRN